MRKFLCVFAALSMVMVAAFTGITPVNVVMAATDYYVATTGNDTNPGTLVQPFKTINKAAQVANPGDTVFIRAGTYRECIKPARGGTSDTNRITYANYNNEVIKVKGSEIVTAWTSQGNGTYSATVSASVFGSYNPFTIALFRKANRTLGEVYLNDQPLSEVDNVSAVAPTPNSWKASADGLTITANFNGVDPNANTVEINVREQVFAPDIYNLGYITIRGLDFYDSANQFPEFFYYAWYSPQKGAVSTSGGHDWEIANCKIYNSKTISLDIGYQGLATLWANGYYEVEEKNIYTAIGRIGHHYIHDNYFEGAGSDAIMGMWAPFSKIVGNNIWKFNRMGFSFSEAANEQAAIKTHFCHDTLIQDNLIQEGNGACGIWADNTYQGIRITGNIFVNCLYGIFNEMGNGPLLVDNNVFIKSPLRSTDGNGAVYAHNLFYDCNTPEYYYVVERTAVVYSPNSADAAYCHDKVMEICNNQYKNNLYIKQGNNIPGGPHFYNNTSDYNSFFDGAAKAYGYDANSTVSSNPTNFSYTSSSNGVAISFTMDGTPWTVGTSQISGFDPVTGGNIGPVTKDFYNNALVANPVPGPFKNLVNGSNNWTLWPKTINPTPTPPSTSVWNMNDNNPGISYTGGTWCNSFNRDVGDFTGDVHACSANNDYFVGSFNGTGVEYITEKNSDRGNVDIYIDNVLAQSGVSCYSTNFQVQQPVFARSGLADGAHTIKVVKTSGTYMAVDYLKITGTAPAPTPVPTPVSRSVTDNCNGDYNLLDLKTTGWTIDGSQSNYFENDTGRYERTTTASDQYMVYYFPNITAFKIHVYYFTGCVPNITMYGSANCYNFVNQLTITKDTAIPTGGGWYSQNWTVSSVPMNTHYIKVLIPGGDAYNWTPQLGKVDFSYGARFDQCKDFSVASSHSSGWDIDPSQMWYFFGDINRFRRTSDTTQYLVYNYTNIHTANIKTFYYLNSPTINFYTSNDGTTWSNVAAIGDTAVLSADYWYQKGYTIPSVPAGTNYLKIEVPASGYNWEPQIAKVQISAGP